MCLLSQELRTYQNPLRAALVLGSGVLQSSLEHLARHFMLFVFKQAHSSIECHAI